MNKMLHNMLYNIYKIIVIYKMIGNIEKQDRDKPSPS